ncbi:MAG: hypothetical protein MJE77_01145 [Proteobacteria bacterium]|nr:hypothetical protein [Pseudomonadota bacterium]
MRGRGGSIYLVRPDWDGDYENMDQAVVEEYEWARHHLRVAPELWRLAGQDQRAADIKAIIRCVYERDRCWMTSDEIERLLQLLDGLEEALVGTVVDEHWMLRPEQLPKLRARTKHLDLDDKRGELALDAVAEGISDVRSLRAILRDARDRGLLLSLD